MVKVVIVGGMDVPSPFGCKEHLDAHHHKDGRHGDQPWHGRVPLVPKVWETWVRQRLKGCGEEVHEGGRDQHACAKMAREEEELVWHWYLGEALDDDWERAS